MDELQQELDIQYAALGIQIIGVNEAGSFESGNDTMCEGRDIPWLQDTSAADWWGTWTPTYRDVLILDAQGELAGVFNLTENSLTDDANYVDLKALLVEIAEAQ